MNFNYVYLNDFWLGLHVFTGNGYNYRMTVCSFTDDVPHERKSINIK